MRPRAPVRQATPPTGPVKRHRRLTVKAGPVESAGEKYWGSGVARTRALAIDRGQAKLAKMGPWSLVPKSRNEAHPTARVARSAEART